MCEKPMLHPSPACGLFNLLPVGNKVMREGSNVLEWNVCPDYALTLYPSVQEGLLPRASTGQGLDPVGADIASGTEATSDHHFEITAKRQQMNADRQQFLSAGRHGRTQEGRTHGQA